MWETHEHVWSVHAKGVQCLSPIYEHGLAWRQDECSLGELCDIQQGWVEQIWVEFISSTYYVFHCMTGRPWTGPDKGTHRFPAPFMALHALPWDHYLKPCLQLILKAAGNKSKATRLEFQTVTNAEIWDVWWGRLGKDLPKQSSFLGQSILSCMMSWDMKTWGQRIWRTVFVYNVSVPGGRGRRRGLEGESIQMLVRSKAFLAVSSSRSLLHSFGV